MGHAAKRESGVRRGTRLGPGFRQEMQLRVPMLMEGLRVPHGISD